MNKTWITDCRNAETEQISIKIGNLLRFTRGHGVTIVIGLYHRNGRVHSTHLSMRWLSMSEYCVLILCVLQSSHVWTSHSHWLTEFKILKVQTTDCILFTCQKILIPPGPSKNVWIRFWWMVYRARMSVCDAQWTRATRSVRIR